LGLGNVGYGVILSALGAGGFLGGFLADWYVERFGEASALILTVLMAATAATTMGFTSSAVVVGGMIFLFGIATTLWNVVAISLRQELTPDPLRGRVAAASKMIAYGAEPIGALVGGLVAAWVGLRGPMLVAGAGLALMVMVVLPIVNETQVEAARAGAGKNR
jgi:predicted MFS family arabinose efflux permease